MASTFDLLLLAASLFHFFATGKQRLRCMFLIQFLILVPTSLCSIDFCKPTAECQPCDLSSLKVQQTNTGQRVGYDPVFEVEVKNQCCRTVSNVFLCSQGFASTMMVDPKLFRREGSGYLVGDGKPISSSSSVKFRYAWGRAFSMSPASFQDDTMNSTAWY